MSRSMVPRGSERGMADAPCDGPERDALTRGRTAPELEGETSTEATG